MLGIDNIKKIVVGVADFSTLVPKVLDGGLTVSDLRYLADVFAIVREFFGLSLGDLKAEIADLDVSEKQELSDLFAERFDLRADTVEAIIEAGVSLVLELIARFLALRETTLAISAIAKKD